MLSAFVLGVLAAAALVGLGVAIHHRRMIRARDRLLAELPLIDGTGLSPNDQGGEPISMCLWSPNDPINGTRIRVRR